MIVRLCGKKSEEGYSCSHHVHHTGPCSRVQWKLDGRNTRIYWWPGHSASEQIGQLIKPTEIEDAAE